MILLYGGIKELKRRIQAEMSSIILAIGIGIAKALVAPLY
jgi:hypothetical protein